MSTRVKILDVLCCLAILALCLYQLILYGLFSFFMSLFNDADGAARWLSRKRLIWQQRGG